MANRRALVWFRPTNRDSTTSASNGRIGSGQCIPSWNQKRSSSKARRSSWNRAWRRIPPIPRTPAESTRTDSEKRLQSCPPRLSVAATTRARFEGSSERELIPSFRYTWDRWAPTVCTLIKSSAAICLFERPVAASLATRSSVSVRLADPRRRPLIRFSSAVAFSAHRRAPSPVKIVSLRSSASRAAPFRFAFR